MKKIILISGVLLACNINSVHSQSKYFTREGNVSFYSDAPLEKIEANNSKAVAVLDAATGQLEFSVLMKAFEFEKALMQEHFNENYAESTKFPKSIFKGKVDNISTVTFDKDGSYPVNVTGLLTLHGVTKEIASKGTIEVKNGKVEANSTFNILLEDYGIKIPKLVNEKVSNSVKIVVKTAFEPFVKS